MVEKDVMCQELERQVRQLQNKLEREMKEKKGLKKELMEEHDGNAGSSTGYKSHVGLGEPGQTSTLVKMKLFRTIMTDYNT